MNFPWISVFVVLHLICKEVLHLIILFSDPSIVPECTTNSDLQNYLYVFLLGQALHGVGGTTLYIVGVALLDDSVPASSSPMYVGK